MVMVINLIELVIIMTILMFLFQKKVGLMDFESYGWIGFGANRDLEIGN